MAYATFEGVIPPGQYGAGTVIVWDRGTWVPDGDPREGYRQGKLKFELQGEKLHGRWTLVRMRGRGNERQEPWLLIKERDETARPAAEYDITEALPDSVNAHNGAQLQRRPQREALPRRQERQSRRLRRQRCPTGARPAKLPLALAPQLATLANAAPSRGDWIYEIKFDGYRVLARVDGATSDCSRDAVTIGRRSSSIWRGRWPALKLPNGWIDGEIVIEAEGGQGRTDFQALQNAFDTSTTADIHYLVFDLPYYADHDLRQVPLRERRNLLRQLMAATHRHI